MKKSLKCLVAATASVISTGAIAATNMENPLYMPQNREVYVKTAVALMYKTVEGTAATDKKGTSGQEEFPVWRFFGDLGYGITDRLDIHGHFGYTRDNEINRKGMHRGRIGLMYRLLTEDAPFVLDLYGDAYLSGISPMKGTYTNKGFDFDNYSNGRWGAIVGTRFGKTWNAFTLGAHVEYLQTFGNHNNKIAINRDVQVQVAPGVYRTMEQLGFPDEISVNLKSTHETVAGFDAMYQMNSKWSLGAGFEYIEHSDNGVKSVHTQMPNATTAKVADGLVKLTADMDDGWDEYVIKTSVTYQVSDDVHFTGFFEYTLDDAHAQSQNATDTKMELGIRMAARF
ncbi:MAG: hypothetical protein IK122_01620 [Alphaproteobacteria bacterium]|nr:hypothetical protein [Alphaproteobacteria bacterium]